MKKKAETEKVNSSDIKSNAEIIENQIADQLESKSEKEKLSLNHPNSKEVSETKASSAVKTRATRVKQSPTEPIVEAIIEEVPLAFEERVKVSKEKGKEKSKKAKEKEKAKKIAKDKKATEKKKAKEKAKKEKTKKANKKSKSKSKKN